MIKDEINWKIINIPNGCWNCDWADFLLDDEYCVQVSCYILENEYPQSKKETLTQINAICDQWTERGEI